MEDHEWHLAKPPLQGKEGLGKCPHLPRLAASLLSFCLLEQFTSAQHLLLPSASQTEMVPQVIKNKQTNKKLCVPL